MNTEVNAGEEINESGEIYEFEVFNPGDVEKISSIYEYQGVVETRLKAVEEKNLFQTQEIRNLKQSLTVYKTILDRSNVSHKELLFEIHNLHVCRNEIRFLTCRIEVLEEFLKSSHGFRN